MPKRVQVFAIRCIFVQVQPFGFTLQLYFDGASILRWFVGGS
jgi:hypothetical protein